jgi:hypothetical protein
MTNLEQLRNQNQSLIATIAEIDLAILMLNDLCEFETGGDAHRLFARLLAGARARDTANHSGDLLSGAKG